MELVNQNDGCHLRARLLRSNSACRDRSWLSIRTSQYDHEFLVPTKVQDRKTVDGVQTWGPLKEGVIYEYRNIAAEKQSAYSYTRDGGDSGFFRIDNGQMIEMSKADTTAQLPKPSNNGLPELTGSEKQVAWATSIRNQVLAVIDAMATRQGGSAAVGKLLKKLMVAQTSAKWWIDHRDCGEGDNLVWPVSMLPAGPHVWTPWKENRAILNDRFKCPQDCYVALVEGAGIYAWSWGPAGNDPAKITEFVVRHKLCFHKSDVRSM